jgi:long-subunit fatty acid transport protein
MILRQTISPALRFGLVGAFFLAGDLSASSGPAQSGLFAFADNAMTAATNPAGLTRIESPEWLGQFALFLSDSTFEKSADQSSGALTADSSSVLVAPFVYHARPIGDNWGIGGSFTALGFGEDPAAKDLAVT